MAALRAHQLASLAYLGSYILINELLLLARRVLQRTQHFFVAVHSQVLIKNAGHVHEHFLFIDQPLAPQRAGGSEAAIQRFRLI